MHGRGNHWRTWVGLLAVVGVLLHAAVVVRHASRMLPAMGSPGLTGTLATDMALICRSGVTTGTEQAPANAPGKGTAEVCPVCAGLVTPFALAAVELPAVAVPDASSAVAGLLLDERQPVQSRIRLSSRGPPATA
jgi:hypothetical protein